MGIFDNSLQVMINNKIVKSIVTTNGATLYKRLGNTSLSINVPLNLVYSDEFNITGALTDIDNLGITGETVYLKVGNTVVDSTTTGSNGAYSFTETPVTTGNHSFQVVFDGNDEYNASNSSIVTRDVGKETSVLTVTAPTNNLVTYCTDSVSFNCSLTDDDGTALTGKSVKVYDGNTLLDTFTTDANGEISDSLSALSVGNHSLSFEFETTSEYTASTVNRTVTSTTVPTSLTFSADDSSIHVGEHPSFTGTLKDNNNNGLGGKPVLIFIGQSLTSIIDTDSNGEFTYTETEASFNTQGSYSFHAGFSGDSTYVGSISENVSVVVSKYDTSLAINVPSTLTYSDSATITGTLTESNTGINGVSVKLKVDDTVVDTQTTNNNGVVSFTYSPSDIGNHSFQLVYDGDSTYNGSTSTTVTKSISKETTVLTVTSPLGDGQTVYYTDSSVPITGTLLTDDNSSVNGKSIVVSENGTTLTTVSTSAGSFSTSVSGLAWGSHTIRFEFAGDTYYNGDFVEKDIFVMNPSYDVSTSVSYNVITGVLTRNGEPWASQSLNFGVWGTTTTDSNGAYSLTVTGVNDGSYLITVSHSNFSVYKNITITNPPSLSLSCSSPIIESGGSTSVVATLTDNSVAMSGETLSYQVKHGSTVISSGTKTTDSNGQATISYTGTGVGDVDVIVSYSTLLQEIFVVEDCHVYTDCTTDENLFYFEGGSHSYSSDGLRIYGATSEKQVFYNSEITTRPVEFSFKWNGNGANATSAQKFTIRGAKAKTGISASNSIYGGYQTQGYYLRKSNSSDLVNYGGQLNVGDVIKLVLDGTSVSYYRNDTLITTNTISDTPDIKYLGWYLNNGRDWYIKDFKIKAL